MREPLKDSIRLQHIQEAIINIEKISNGISLDDLKDNIVLRHAITWNIMVIGEAANKLTKDFCSTHTSTDWRAITGMRNVLVHDYYEINESELFSVITDDIPVLKKQIEEYIIEQQQIK